MHGPFKGRLGFQVPFVSPKWSESPLILTARFLRTPLPGTRTWAGELDEGLGPLTSQVGPL